jgi:hypothetical protein
VEEPVSIDAIPAAARASTEKLASGGRDQQRRIVTNGQTATVGALIAKGLNKSEVVVATDCLV